VGPAAAAAGDAGGIESPDDLSQISTNPTLLTNPSDRRLLVGVLD